MYFEYAGSLFADRLASCFIVVIRVQNRPSEYSSVEKNPTLFYSHRPFERDQPSPHGGLKVLVAPLPLCLRIHVTSLQRQHATVSRADRSLGTGNRRVRAKRGCTNPAERTHSTTWRHRHLDVFRTARDQLLRQAFDVDALGRVVVRGRDDFDNLVARELQAGNVCGRAGHQVAVQDAED